jgi:hypothetical protein
MAADLDEPEPEPAPDYDDGNDDDEHLTFVRALVAALVHKRCSD